MGLAMKIKVRSPRHGTLMLFYEVYRDFASKYRKDLPPRWEDLSKYTNAEISVMPSEQLEGILAEMHAILWPDPRS